MKLMNRRQECGVKNPGRTGKKVRPLPHEPLIQELKYSLVSSFVKIGLESLACSWYRLMPVCQVKICWWLGLEIVGAGGGQEVAEVQPFKGFIF
jgi:hypothetical protein